MTRASILAVGSELVIGQTLNKNAPWLSSRLKELGMLTSLHLAVPDERALIRDGLKYCGAHSEIILVTGGLGPTTDDFTRDLIAEWACLETEFDEGSWQKIKERMSFRNLPVQDFQKQQCFFPKGACILHNSEGTANGFRIHVHKKDLIALPGPPREINAIWTSSLETWFSEKTRHIDKYLTWSWDTHGLGESQVMQLTERALAGHPFLNGEIDVGYRVHGPRINLEPTATEVALLDLGTKGGPEKNFVEVKLSCYESQKKLVAPWAAKLEEALRDVIVSSSGSGRIKNV